MSALEEYRLRVSVNVIVQVRNSIVSSHATVVLLCCCLVADNSRKARCSYFVIGMVPVSGGKCVASRKVVLFGPRWFGHRVESSYS